MAWLPESDYQWFCPSVTSWSRTSPHYVGNDYFCGTSYVPNSSLVPWDDKQCSREDHCCLLDSLPFFCKELGYTSTDDIEMRWFLDFRQNVMDVSFVEIYIKCLGLRPRQRTLNEHLAFPSYFINQSSFPVN